MWNTKRADNRGITIVVLITCIHWAIEPSGSKINIIKKNNLKIIIGSNPVRLRRNGHSYIFQIHPKNIIFYKYIQKYYQIKTKLV